MRHTHRWQLVKREVRPDPDRPGHNIIYEFFECVGEGKCPKPDKVEISRK